MSVIDRSRPILVYLANGTQGDAAMGVGTGRRVASKFRFFASHRQQTDAMLAGAFEAQPGLADFRPTSIEQWVRRHAEEFCEAGRLAATGDS